MLGEMSRSTLLHWETSWDELHQTEDGTVLAGSALREKKSWRFSLLFTQKTANKQDSVVYRTLSATISP